MTSEEFVNKYGESFFKEQKLVSFYNDVHKLNSERIKSLESKLKEKDVIISEYHTKMIADKESYFEVVEAHDDLKSQNKELSERGSKLISIILARKPTEEIGYLQEEIKTGINKLK